MKRRLGYLSGAPRVSTDVKAALGGPRSHVLGVIRAFESLGWEVSQFIVGNRVPRSWVETGSERRIARSWLRALAADLLRLGMGAIFARVCWRTLRDEVDWVYERFATLQAMGWIFKKHGKLWILETNGLAFLEASDRRTLFLEGLARRLEFRAYRRCDYLVCVSSALRDMILSRVKIRADKVIVVPNGIDPLLFDPSQHNPIRMFEGFTVGYAGSLIQRQNIDLLLESLHDLNQDNISISLTVVGDGPMRQQWETLAGSLGLASRVHFVGQVPPDVVPDYILGFDVGFAGHRELPGCPIFYSPLKVYEYLAMEVLVVASRHQDTQRVIEDGKTGFLFNAGSREELKKALQWAYDRRANLHQQGRRARKQVLANDTWISRVSGLISYIETMTDAAGGQPTEGHP